MRAVFCFIFLFSLTLNGQVFIPFGFWRAGSPTISAFPNTDLPVGVMISLAFTITHPTNTLVCGPANLSVTSSNATVLPLVNISISGTAPNCFLNMYTVATSGSSTVQVTVTSFGMSSVSNSFTATAFQKPIMAFSFRKIVSDWAGSAMRLRRVSDNVEQDIGFTGAGEFNTTAYTTFIGGSSARLVRWYDQTGNGYHADQTTPSLQPTITLNAFGAKPQVNFLQTYYLQTLAQATNVLNLNRDVTVFFATKAASVQQVNFGSYSTSDASDRVLIHINWDDGNIYWDAPGYCCGPARISLGNSANVGLPKVYVFGRQNTYQYIKINGTTIVSRNDASGTYIANTNPWYLGTGATPATFNISAIPLAEYLQFKTGLTDAQVTSISNEQKNYFGL